MIQKIKGTNDFFGREMVAYKKVEEKLLYIAQLYNFQEIRTPILEFLPLFTTSVGTSSEIVQKQMYSFFDKKNRDIVLRPEGTAGVVRTVIENKLLFSQPMPLKYFYLGPMFRYERPQANRRRQFHQFGVETIGSGNVCYLTEQILLASAIVRELELDEIELQINYLGDSKERVAYNQSLKKYFYEHQDKLSPLSQKRLEINPLRIFDSKEPSDIALVKNAPIILDYLQTDSKKKFAAIKTNLNAFNITYKIEPGLVRGLDYYTGLIYEFVANEFQTENTSTIIGGGSYDNLFELLGSKSKVPASGFAIGLERVVNLLINQPEYQSGSSLDVFVVDKFDTLKTGSLKEQEELKKLMNIKPWILMILRYAGFKADGSYDSLKLKKQYEIANASNAKYVVELDPELLISQKLTVKNLLNEKVNVITVSDLIKFFAQCRRDKIL